MADGEVTIQEIKDSPLHKIVKRRIQELVQDLVAEDKVSVAGVLLMVIDNEGLAVPAMIMFDDQVSDVAPTLLGKFADQIRTTRKVN